MVSNIVFVSPLPVEMIQFAHYSDREGTLKPGSQLPGWHGWILNHHGTWDGQQPKILYIYVYIYIYLSWFIFVQVQRPGSFKMCRLRQKSSQKYPLKESWCKLRAVFGDKAPVILPCPAVGEFWRGLALNASAFCLVSNEKIVWWNYMIPRFPLVMTVL